MYCYWLDDWWIDWSKSLFIHWRSALFTLTHNSDSDWHVSASYLNFGLSLVFTPLFRIGFMASSLVCALPACLAWAWTYPAGMSTCSWRSFPLRTGGQNLISSLSISPYPVEQDALFTPNRSGNLPTAHIWAQCMHGFFRKMSTLFSFWGFWSELIRFLLI